MTKQRKALIAWKQCHCVVAVDLDYDYRSLKKYIERGYVVAEIDTHKQEAK